MRHPTFRCCVSLLLAFSACKSQEAKQQDNAPTAAAESTAAAKPTAATPTAAAKPAEPPAPPATPCDGPEMAELSKQLRLANGNGVDFSDAKAGQATVDAAIAAINGKRVAFTSCAFKSQGNDEVSFAPRKDSSDDDEIDCKMAGGEAGNKAFRDAAMSIDMARLQLDVVGVVGSYKDVNDFTRYTLTDCKVTPRE